MEQDKLAHEAEEKEKAEKEKKVKEGYSFDDASQQWEKDKNAVSNMVIPQEQRDIAGSDSAPNPESSGKAEPAGNDDDLKKQL